MEVDVRDVKKLIILAESMVLKEKKILRGLKHSLKGKGIEALILEGVIEGVKTKKLNEEEKQYLENKITRLEEVKERMGDLEKQIAFWEKKLKNDVQILNKWNKKVKNAEN